MLSPYMSLSQSQTGMVSTTEMTVSIATVDKNTHGRMGSSSSRRPWRGFVRRLRVCSCGMQYGGEESGGVGLAQARELYGRADISSPLESVFALADRDGNGRLNYPEFLFFMYLLKVLRKGAKLPKGWLSDQKVSRSRDGAGVALMSGFSCTPCGLCADGCSSP